ncbi:hypothetical protein ACS0TY_009238 [Phlomoides rotata]
MISNSESGNDPLDISNQNPTVDSSVPVINPNTIPNPNTAVLNPNPSNTFTDTYATFTINPNPFVNPNPYAKANIFVFTAFDPNNLTDYMTPLMVHSKKPDKFLGSNFKRWHQKMLFYFYVTTLQLASYLKEDPTVVDENETDTARRIVYDQWTYEDFLCRNHVLGRLVDHLYKVYHKTHTFGVNFCTPPLCVFYTYFCLEHSPPNGAPTSRPPSPWRFRPHTTLWCVRWCGNS